LPSFLEIAPCIIVALWFAAIAAYHMFVRSDGEAIKGELLTLLCELRALRLETEQQNIRLELLIDELKSALIDHRVRRALPARN